MKSEVSSKFKKRRPNMELLDVDVRALLVRVQSLERDRLKPHCLPYSGRSSVEASDRVVVERLLSPSLES